MKTESDFTTLIITYNSADEIANLLNDLRRLAPSNHSRVIVIDNLSQDGTAGLIAQKFPEVRLVENRQNVGFARAVNQGFELCETEYVFLLNPDMRLVQPDFHSAMLACMQASPKIAAVGPLQFNNTGPRRRLSFNWSYYSARTLAVYLSYLFGREPKSREPLPTGFLNCGCLLLRKSIFLQVGKLNEKYFLYGEEPDLFLKFKRWEYEARLHPGVEVVHYRDRSLNTLPAAKRLLRRLQALGNIGDALFRGYSRIVLGRLHRQPPTRS
jgi:GT2 family glycosyltransferase